MTAELHTKIVAQEIAQTVDQLNQEQLQAVVNELVAAQRLFVCGTGRSLLMMKALAMRLMHVGLEAYVVGETVTPAIEPGDLLMAGSGSGQTRTTLAYIQAAAAEGARTVALTAHPDSPVAAACDLILEIPAPIIGALSLQASVQPPGSRFEQCLLVVNDAVVLEVMQRLGITVEQMRARHTKLE